LKWNSYAWLALLNPKSSCLQLALRLKVDIIENERIENDRLKLVQEGVNSGLGCFFSGEL